MSTLHDCRKAFSDTLVALAEADPRVVVVANDSVGSSNLKEFKKRFPKRLVNVGIAEQNLVGVGAGLANGGLLPFVCGASCFLTGRALEQVKVDLGYSRSNVKLCGMSSGVAYGELGPTHHSIEDLAWTRAIANMTVIVPADPLETAREQRLAARGLPARGIKQGEGEITQLRGRLAHIARHSRRVIDNGAAPSDQAIEQRRFADIRTADDRDPRKLLLAGLSGAQ